MAETKMNKTRRCAGRLCAFIRLKCNFIFTIQKILFFFSPNQQPSSPKFFWGRFDSNATIKWSTKIQKVSRLRVLEREHRPRRLQTFNITQIHLNLLTVAFDESHMTRDSAPTAFHLFNANVSPSLST